MTPEEQIETYKAIEDSAAVMVVAELRLIRQAAQVATVLFLLFLLMIFGAVIANAAPIEALPLPTQRWYTADIPTPEGVFAFEVYAPVLPRIVASDLEPIYVLGDPPRLVDMPEPGTGWMMVLATGIGFVLWVSWMVNKWRSCLRSDREAMERAEKVITGYEKALMQVLWKSTDEVAKQNARKAVIADYEKALIQVLRKSTDEVARQNAARKALEGE